MSPKKKRAVANKRGRITIKNRMKKLKNGVHKHSMRELHLPITHTESNMVNSVSYSAGIETTAFIDTSDSMVSHENSGISEASDLSKIDSSMTDNHVLETVEKTSTPNNQETSISDMTLHTTSSIRFSELSENDSSMIENHNLETTIDNNIDTDANCFYGGRRIVDMEHVFAQILELSNKLHTPGLGCSFMNVEFQNEIRKGFESSWIFKCKMCNRFTTIESESKELHYIPINKAVINGTYAIGIGYTQLAEFSASVDVPCMAPKTYSRHNDLLSIHVESTAWNAMQLAGIEEKKLALEAGDLDSDGIPMCPVIADGQWSKRSYKTKYDAFSGAATIIGFRTKKVLFVGIRNRYCVICERAKNIGQSAVDHKCFLNWTKGATSIEADAIAEGFLCSVEMHGLKFNKLIGDGDSSVHKRLNEVMPYGPQFLIEKIECRNHILRNYGQKLMHLTKNTKYPCFLRKFIKKNILRFRTAITKAIKYRNQINESYYQQIEGLRKDLKNSPYHIFGEHSNCDKYFCTGQKLKEQNIVFEITKCGLMTEISFALRRVIDNSKSLLLDVDNNICEQFNSLINKHVAGKRINFSQKQCYSTRVYTAVVSFNTSGNFIREIHKKITNKSPGIIAKKYLKYTADKRNNLKNRRALFRSSGIFKKKIGTCGPDENYGLAQPLDDFLPKDELKQKKNHFIKSITLSPSSREQIELETRNQANDQKWFVERRNRLSASNFGRVCKMRQNTSCRNTVHDILYGNVSTSAMQYGKQFEEIGIHKLQEIIEKPINKCGLFIDADIPYLAATPDGLVEDNSIVEVKCPYSIKDYDSLERAIFDKKIPYMIKKDNKIVLKEYSNYYYQIQGQMHITKRKLCFFFIYTSKWTYLEKIKYNDSFWKTKMESQLKLFYEECLLMEIVDPQFSKRMLKSDILDPPHIREKQNEKINII